MNARAGDSKRRGNVASIGRRGRLILPDSHPIELYAHDLSPILVVDALRRLKAERVISCSNVESLRCGAIELQECHLRTLWRCWVTAGERVAATGYPGAGCEDPSRPRW